MMSLKQRRVARGEWPQRCLLLLGGIVRRISLQIFALLVGAHRIAHGIDHLCTGVGHHASDTLSGGVRVRLNKTETRQKKQAAARGQHSVAKAVPEQPLKRSRERALTLLGAMDATLLNLSPS